MLHTHRFPLVHKVSMFASLIADYQEENQWAACFALVSQGDFLCFTAHLCTGPKVENDNINVLLVLYLKEGSNCPQQLLFGSDLPPPPPPPWWTSWAAFAIAQYNMPRPTHTLSETVPHFCPEGLGAWKPLDQAKGWILTIISMLIMDNKAELELLGKALAGVWIWPHSQSMMWFSVGCKDIWLGQRGGNDLVPGKFSCISKVLKMTSVYYL